MPPHIVNTRHASGDAVCAHRILMALVCVVLVACTAAPRMAAAQSKSSFTWTQQWSTLMFLQGFATPAWGLDTIWVGTDFCTWMYVTCDSAYVTVALDTLVPATTATLPELADNVVGSQVMVRRLSASGLGGRLTGTLPASWSRLSWLMEVTLADNALSGTLPAELASLSLLSTLDISGNALSGTLPQSWVTLYYLSTLLLGGNKLSGPLPEMWSQLAHLSSLSLRGNELSGTLPATWVVMQRLQTVDLSSNELSGTFPVDWYAMPRTLSSLLLNNNRLSGPISVFLGYFSLEELDISKNAFCGCAPPLWNTSSTMKFTADPELRATDCAVVNACDVHDSSSPQHSATLRFLQGFIVSMPSLQGQWMGSWYCGWRGVTCTRTAATVDLSNVSLTTSGCLPELASDVDGSMVVVTQVRVVGCGSLVSGRLPASWSRVSQLMEVTLSGNALSGPLPAEWASLYWLRTLDMSGNALSGSLPYDWSQLSQLSVLSLGRNALNGPLSSDWALLRQLQTLDLSHNQLSGTLPVGWYAMSSLRYLYLNNNRLSGSIPMVWWQIPFDAMDISNNALSSGRPF